MDATKTDVYFSTSQKGSNMLASCGYEYTFRRRNINGSTVWRCVRRRQRCPGYALLTRDGLFEVKRQHTCTPDPIKTEVNKEWSLCKQRAAVDNSSSVSTLYVEFLDILKQKGDCYYKAAPSQCAVTSALYRIKSGKTSLGRSQIN